MSLFIGLPDTVGKEVLLDWMTFAEISKIEVAFCCHSLRQSFLQYLVDIPFRYPVIKNNGIKNFHNWCVSRGVRLTELIWGPYDVIDRDFVNSLSHLKSLTSLGEPLEPINGNILKELTSINLVFSSTTDLQLMKEFCRNLRSLSIKRFFDSDIIVDLLRLNPHLVELKITMDSTIRDGIVQYCSHSLRTLSILRLDPEKWDYNLNFLCKLSRLESVNLDHKDFYYDKKNGILNLRIMGSALPGWEEFLQSIPPLNKVILLLHEDLNCEFVLAIFRHHRESIKDIDFIVINSLGFNNAKLQHLLLQAENLQRLWVYHFNGAVYDYSATFSVPNKLKTLILSSCQSESQLLPVLQSCPELESIDFLVKDRDDCVEKWSQAVLNFYDSQQMKVSKISLKYSGKNLVFQDGKFTEFKWGILLSLFPGKLEIVDSKLD